MPPKYFWFVNSGLIANRIDKPGSFQKTVDAYYPAWINKVTVQKEGGTVKHVVFCGCASLLAPV